MTDAWDQCIVCLDADVPPADRWRDAYPGAGAETDVAGRRACPMAGACRGNRGVCDACEALLDRCVICRSPLPPPSPHGSGAADTLRAARSHCFGMSLLVIAAAFAAASAGAFASALVASADGGDAGEHDAGADRLRGPLPVADVHGLD